MKGRIVISNEGLMVRPKRVLLLQSKNTAHLCIKIHFLLIYGSKNQKVTAPLSKNSKFAFRQDIISDKVTNWQSIPIKQQDNTSLQNNSTNGLSQIKNFILSTCATITNIFLVFLKIPSCPKWKPSVIFPNSSRNKKTHRCSHSHCLHRGIRAEKSEWFPHPKWHSECLSTS